MDKEISIFSRYVHVEKPINSSCTYKGDVCDHNTDITQCAVVNIFGSIAKNTLLPTRIA
jgi:hypothetical protein